MLVDNVHARTHTQKYEYARCIMATKSPLSWTSWFTHLVAALFLQCGL